MKDGVASQTARSVAARRLTYERAPADYGRPEADIALMRDVAAGLEPSPGRMHEYIRARTAFFDRVVVRAVGSGVRQVVVGAAGYDGRSLRYAKPGLRSVTESVLTQFREVTVAGSLLAISVSVTSGARGPGSRSRFRQTVADMGEPARSELSPDEAEALLTRAGWEVRDLTDPADPAASARSQRLRGAGLLTARAAARPEPGDRVTRKRSLSPVPPDERGLPLHALLSRALVAFTIEADNEAGHRLPHRTTGFGLAPGSPPGAPWVISLAMWASSLRLIPDEGITVAELRRTARTGTNLPGLRRWRYLTFDPEPTRSKRPADDAVIRLTAHGRTARDEWARVTSEVEDRWRHRFGAEAVQALRTALEAVAARLPAGLPDSLPILGFGLYSRVAEQLPGGDAGIAPDAGPEDVAGLPLWALLSRVLLACAVEYESESRVSLAISANVLQVLTAAGVRVRDIPDLAGVSKEAVAMATGILAKFGLATEGRDPAGGRWRVARLTSRGERAQVGYHALVCCIAGAIPTGR